MPTIASSSAVTANAPTRYKGKRRMKTDGESAITSPILVTGVNATLGSMFDNVWRMIVPMLPALALVRTTTAIADCVILGKERYKVGGTVSYTRPIGTSPTTPTM